MSVTAPRGLPGLRDGGRAQGVGPARCRPRRQRRATAPRRRGLHRQPGPGRARRLVAAGGRGRPRRRRPAQLRRGERLYRRRRLRRHPSLRRARRRRCSAVACGDVAVCSTGLIGERLPMIALLAGATPRCGALTAGGGADAARAIMTTDTVPKTAVVRDADGWSVGGMAKGAGMLAPGLATMLVVLTTDAVVPPGRARRRPARRRPAPRSTASTPTAACRPTTPCCSWAAAPAASSPAPAAFAAAVHEVCARLARGPRRATPRAPATTSRSRSSERAPRGRRRRGRPVGRPQQPVQGGRLRQGPELGAGPRRRRHDPGGVRPGHPRRDASTASRSAGHAASGRTAPSSTCPDARGARRRRPPRRDRRRHGLDQRPHPRLRPREQRLLHMTA